MTPPDLWNQRIAILNWAGVSMPERGRLARLDIAPDALRSVVREAYAEGKRGDQIAAAVRSMVDEHGSTPPAPEEPGGEVGIAPDIEGPVGEPLAETEMDEPGVSGNGDDGRVGMKITDGRRKRSMTTNTVPRTARGTRSGPAHRNGSPVKGKSASEAGLPALDEKVSPKPARRGAANKKRLVGRPVVAKGRAASLKLVAQVNSAAAQEPAGKLDRQPAKSLPEVIYADLAARHFRVTLRTWRRWDSAGRIPPGFKIGGRKLWRAADLESWANWGFSKRDDFVARVRVEESGR